MFQRLAKQGVWLDISTFHVLEGCSMNTRREVNTVIYMHPEGILEGVVVKQIKESGMRVISVLDQLHANMYFYIYQPEIALFVVDFEVDDQQGLDFVLGLLKKEALNPYEVALVSGDFEVRDLASRHGFHFFDKGDGGFVEELIRVARKNAIRKNSPFSGTKSDDVPVAV